MADYERVNWQNDEIGGTPLSADNLNIMDEGIAKLDAKVPFRFGVDGDGNYGYYKADDSFSPFRSGGGGGDSEILEMLQESYSVFLSTKGDDKIQYSTNGTRYTQRNGNTEPLLMCHAIYFDTANTYSNACIAKSATARSAVTASTYGNWTTNTGTAVTPKGHTVYWGRSGGAAASNGGNAIVSGGVKHPTTTIAILVDNVGVTDFGLWVADKLLFNE